MGIEKGKTMAKKDANTALTAAAVDAKMIAAEENLVIDVQFLIQDVMNETVMTRAELAKRTGLSKARLTQIMRPEANLTLRTVARLLYALNEEVVVSRKSAAKSAKFAELIEIKWDTCFKEAATAESRTAKSRNAFRASILHTLDVSLSPGIVMEEAINENHYADLSNELPAVA